MQNLWKNRRGVAALEYAIIGGVFGMVLIYMFWTWGNYRNGWGPFYCMDIVINTLAEL